MIDTKEKILLTALRLFARDGYEAVSVSTIAGELGMTASNISAPTAAWLIPTYWVREWFGTVHQFLFG